MWQWRSCSSSILQMVNAPDAAYGTPLQLAEDKAMAQFLLAHGARVALGGGVVLLTACQFGKTELVQLLLDAAASDDDDAVLDCVVNHGRSNSENLSGTPLYIACWEGHFDVVKVLLEHGAEWRPQEPAPPPHSDFPDPPFQFCIDALPRQSLKDQYRHISTKDKAIEFVELILAKEALYDQLVQAIKANNWDVAQQLLDDQEAFPNTLNRSKSCQSPLGLAVQQNNVEWAQRLLHDYGANINNGGSGNWKWNVAPLLVVADFLETVAAADEDRWAMFRLLIETDGVEVNAPFGCCSPLHIACMYGQVEMVQTLLQKGADVHALDVALDEDDGGNTPLHCACRWLEGEDDGEDENTEAVSRKVRILQLLLEYGSNTEAKDSANHQTPLHLLAGGQRSPRQLGRPEVQAVRLLLQHGAQVDALDGKTEDHHGRTALNLAICKLNYDLAQALIVHGKANVHIGSGIPMTNLFGRPPPPVRRSLRLMQLMLKTSEATLTKDKDGLLEARCSRTGRTPLHIACQEANYRAAKVLLAHGADLLAGTIDGSSCVTFAREHRGHRKKAFAKCFERTVRLAQTCLDGDNAADRIQSLLAPLDDDSGDVFPQFKVPVSGDYVLHCVCRLGLMGAAQRLVSKGASIAVKRNRDGKTPLDLAREAGHKELAESLEAQQSKWSSMTPKEINQRLFELLELGSDDDGDKQQQQAYYCAVKDCIVSGGANVNGIDVDDPADRRTPLHVAAGYGDFDVVQLLIEQGANVNARSASGATPLHASVRCGSLRIARLLLVNGADCMATTKKSGNTPLHLASAYNHTGIAKLLLAHGADILARNHANQTPHAVPCLRRGQGATEELWLNTGELVHTIKALGSRVAIENWKSKRVFGNVKIVADDDQQSVTWSESVAKSVKFVTDCQQGRFDTTEQFARLNMVRQTEAKETEGEFLLHFFCRSLPMVVHLVKDCGAKVNVQRSDGMTPLAVAAQHGQADTVEWFLKECGDALHDLPDHWGNTPLHHACRHGHLNVVELLLDDNVAAASLLARQNWLLETPCDSAAQHDRSDVVAFLTRKRGSDTVDDVQQKDVSQHLNCLT